jgi:hypothetical protein
MLWRLGRESRGGKPRARQASEDGSWDANSLGTVEAELSVTTHSLEVMEKRGGIY